MLPGDKADMLNKRIEDYIDILAQKYDDPYGISSWVWLMNDEEAIKFYTMVYEYHEFIECGTEQLAATMENIILHMSNRIISKHCES